MDGFCGYWVLFSVIWCRALKCIVSAGGRVFCPKNVACIMAYHDILSVVLRPQQNAKMADHMVSHPVGGAFPEVGWYANGCSLNSRRTYVGFVINRFRRVKIY